MPVLIVLDASALLSLVNKEPGWDLVARQTVNQDVTISAVNYAEVLQKANRLGVAAEDIDALMDTLGLTASPFSRLDARLAASFYRHRSGLSLSDRVCLALARSITSPAYTPIGCGQASSAYRSSSSGRTAPCSVTTPAGREERSRLFDLVSRATAVSPPDR